MTTQRFDISDCPRDPACGPTVALCLFGGVLYGAEASAALLPVDVTVVDLDNTPDAEVPPPFAREVVAVVEGGLIRSLAMGPELGQAGARVVTMDFTDRDSAAGLPTLPPALVPVY